MFCTLCVDKPVLQVNGNLHIHVHVNIVSTYPWLNGMTIVQKSTLNHIVNMSISRIMLDLTSKQSLNWTFKNTLRWYCCRTFHKIHYISFPVLYIFVTENFLNKQSYTCKRFDLYYMLSILLWVPKDVR